MGIWWRVSSEHVFDIFSFISFNLSYLIRPYNAAILHLPLVWSVLLFNVLVCRTVTRTLISQSQLYILDSLLLERRYQHLWLTETSTGLRSLPCPLYRYCLVESLQTQTLMWRSQDITEFFQYWTRVECRLFWTRYFWNACGIWDFKHTLVYLRLPACNAEDVGFTMRDLTSTMNWINSNFSVISTLESLVGWQCSHKRWLCFLTEWGLAKVYGERFY